jgi:hypothetical protein
MKSSLSLASISSIQNTAEPEETTTTEDEDETLSELHNVEKNFTKNFYEIFSKIIF